MATTGVVYIKVRLQLNQDIPVDEVEGFVSELDYSFIDERGVVANTEIMASGTSPDL